MHDLQMFPIDLLYQNRTSYLSLKFEQPPPPREIKSVVTLAVHSRSANYYKAAFCNDLLYCNYSALKF
jgi:hypothetical protein